MAQRSPRRKKVQKLLSEKQMLLGPQNYQLLLIAVLSLLVGFGGMYIENEFLGWFSLYVSPLLIIGGFILVVFGIMKTEASADSTETAEKV